MDSVVNNDTCCISMTTLGFSSYSCFLWFFYDLLAMIAFLLTYFLFAFTGD